MKRIFALLLTLSLLLAGTACASGAQAAGPSMEASPAEAAFSAERNDLAAGATDVFQDVPADAWYAQAVTYCRQQGIMNGTGPASFSPTGTLTRSMMATLLYRMSGSPTVQTSPTFQDAKAGEWYSDAIVWANDTGIMTGYGDQRFGVTDPTTREQAVTILWRYQGSPEAQDGSGLSDTDSASDWARAAVRWANGSGMLEGIVQDGQFLPKVNIQRGEVASLLWHMRGDSRPTQSEASAARKTLVVYFSCTNTTEAVAKQIAELQNADLFEILPEDPYTEADLAYYTGGRADQEQNNPSARPAIANRLEHLEDYDVVFLGYPIWHGQAPRILSTFLETCDLTGKTIVPFCTSHSSGIGSSDTALHALAEGASWLPGHRFPGGASESEISDWLQGLALPKAS